MLPTRIVVFVMSTNTTSHRPISPFHGPAYEALKADIHQFGQRSPIYFDREGRIWDGEARARICAELGITPNIAIVDDGPAAFLSSLKGRQLTPQDRADILAWILERERANFARHPGRTDDHLAAYAVNILGWTTGKSPRQIVNYLTLATATAAEREAIAASNTTLNRAHSALKRARKAADPEQKTTADPDAQDCRRIDDLCDRLDVRLASPAPVPTPARTRLVNLANRILSTLGDAGTCGGGGGTDSQAGLASSFIRSGATTPADSDPAAEPQTARAEHDPDPEALAPRPYQTRVVDKVITSIESGVMNVLIVLPTAAGKMVVALMVLARLLADAERYFGKPVHQVRIAWVALRRELLHQARRENRLWKLVPEECLVFVTIFQNDIPTADILVFDEGQHAAADRALSTHTCVNPTVTIALTATPYRADRAGLPYQAVISDCGTALMIADGYLCQFDYYTLSTWDVNAVTAVIVADPQRWGPTIAFFRTIAECDHAVGLLKAAKVSAAVVAGDRDNTDTLHQFRSGQVQVLLSVALLAEGFNVPELMTVFIRDAGRGPTIQMGGRALRLHPSKTVARIVQSANTRYAFTRLAMPVRSFSLDGECWREVAVRPEADAIQRTMHEHLSKTDVSLPDYITRRSQTRSGRTPRRGRSRNPPSAPPVSGELDEG